MGQLIIGNIRICKGLSIYESGECLESATRVNALSGDGKLKAPDRGGEGGRVHQGIEEQVGTG